MLYSLIVKGTKHDAMKEAERRGIPFAFLRERNGEVLGYTGAQVASIAAWFLSNGEDAPYEAGSLLYYSPLE